MIALSERKLCYALIRQRIVVVGDMYMFGIYHAEIKECKMIAIYVI